MARIPVVTRDMVPDEFRGAFDELTRDTGGSITGGPGSITINSPEMSRRRSHLTAYLRFESTFPKRIQELAILATARAMDCPYIWNAHAPAARGEGVSDALVDALRDRQPLPPMAADESAIVNFCTEFYQNHRVSASTFQIAQEQFGVQHLVEITPQRLWETTPKPHSSLTPLRCSCPTNAPSRCCRWDRNTPFSELGLKSGSGNKARFAPAAPVQTPASRC